MSNSVSIHEVPFLHPVYEQAGRTVDSGPFPSPSRINAVTKDLLKVIEINQPWDDMPILVVPDPAQYLPGGIRLKLQPTQLEEVKPSLWRRGTTSTMTEAAAEVVSPSESSSDCIQLGSLSIISYATMTRIDSIRLGRAEPEEQEDNLLTGLFTNARSLYDNREALIFVDMVGHYLEQLSTQ